MSEEYMTLEEFIKQNNLKPVEHVVEYPDEVEVPNDDDTLMMPRDRHILSADEWNSILG